jgi:endonuclease/exonuclease/phosphatase family metal-dependent hydrolase
LIAGSRVRQLEQVGRFIDREIPRREPLLVAGDFNDWGTKLRPVMNRLGMKDFVAPRLLTYPSRLPLTQLDYVYARGLKPVGVEIPKGRIWWRMSDHLPLIAEFKL